MKVHQFMYEMQETAAVFGRKSDVQVVFEGQEAKTDGNTIYLPSMDMEADLTHAQIMNMRGFVDHEAGHIRHSDMDRLIDFYDRNQNNGRPGLSRLHNALEDVWMERKVVEEYPGAHKNLRHLSESCSTMNIEAIKKAGKEEELKEINLTSVMGGIVGQNPGYEYGPDSSSEAFKGMLGDKVRKWTEKWAQDAYEASGTEELITMAKSIWKLLEEDPELESMEPEDFDPTSGADMDEGEPSPDKGEGKGKAELMEGGEDGEDGHRLTNADLPEDYMPEAGGVVEDDKREEEGGVGGIGNPDGPLKSKGYRAYTTREDVTYNRGKTMKHGGVRQLQAVVDSQDYGRYVELKGNVAANVNVMKTKLRRALMAKQQRDWDFGKEDGRLDSKRLVKAYNLTPTVYKQRTDRTDTDTAITVLIDLSGSMGGKKARVARDCTVALSECLEGSNMPFKVVGFTNYRYPSDRNYNALGMFHRYEPLDTVVFKEYGDSLRKCRGSIAGITDAVGGNNSDYDFIRQEINILKARPESRKVLFVLSDGHPACMTDASTSELIKHCRNAIKDGARSGVESVGIGICDSTVKKIYDDAVVVNSVDDLSSKVFNKLTGLLV